MGQPKGYWGFQTYTASKTYVFYLEMNYDMPTLEVSPTPTNWLDMLNSNSVCFDENNNANGHTNLENSKMFNADISMFDLPDINMLMDANIEENFTNAGGFDNVNLMEDLNASLEPIPKEFFLSKELSSQFMNMKAPTDKQQNQRIQNSATNKKLIDELKDAVYNNDGFQKQVVENIDQFLSPNNMSKANKQKSDNAYIVTDNTPGGYKFPSEVKNKNKSSSPTVSPLKNKNNKSFVLDKYVNVSDDDEEETNEDANIMQFNLQTSPIRQPANKTNYYTNGDSSPVASTNYIQQNSPIRKKQASKNNLQENNNNLSFFDVPQLQFNDDNSHYDSINVNPQNPYYQPPPQFAHYGANNNLKQMYPPMGHAEQYHPYDSYVNQQQNFYNNASFHNYQKKQNSTSSHNNTIVSNTSASSNGHINNNPKDQRLKSYNSVGTSQSTILEEPSPYQQQLATFDSTQHSYQRVVSNSNSHTSSVQRKMLGGLGLNIKAIKEEQELALNDALLNKSKRDNAELHFDLVKEMNETGTETNKQPTKKLSKFETPQLQQIPFFSSSQQEQQEVSPKPSNNTLVSCQYVKIQSPTQEKPLIGMINRSPKGVRKKSTLPPGTIDQYIAELSDKTFICLFNDCQRKFPRRYNIRAHVQTHLQDKPHSCDICGNSFVRNHDLVRHKKTHMEKKFNCDSCGKPFLTENLVEQHKESHKCSGTHNTIIQTSPVDIGDAAAGKKKKAKAAADFGTQVVSKSGRVTKPISPKKQQHEKTENALEFKNTMAAVSNVNKVVKKDTYHFNTVKF